MSLDNCRIHLVETTDDAFELMRWLSGHELIALDTETSGLSPENDHVRLVQLSDAEDAWVVPFKRWGGIVEDVVRQYEGWYVCHNAVYDVAMLRTAGIELPHLRVHDTRLMAHVLESTGSTALKNLAKRFIDPHAGIGQSELDAALSNRGGWTWATVPIDYQPYWAYAGLDAILTYRLYEQLYPRVLAEAPASYDLELAVSWVCERMERHGVLVDRDYTKTFVDNLDDYIKKLEKWCYDVYGISPGSSSAVERILTQDGILLTKRTANRSLSLDKEVLSDIDHPLAQAVLGRRQAQKISSTYLHQYLTLAEHNARIHPSINSIGGMAKNPYEPGGSKGVRTGRMSMNNPNLQNVPVRTREGNGIRNCFIVSEGHSWVKCDFSQIEMRILTHLCQDSALALAFQSGGDFFTNVAKQLFSEPNFSANDSRRSLTKNAMYALTYGAGNSKFAGTAGVSEEQASAFMANFHRSYPAVKRFTRKLEGDGLTRLNTEGEAYVRSPLTNRKHSTDPKRLYTLTNYLIQGMAGEILKMKIVEADQAGLGEFMILPVHDEIDLEIPNDVVKDVVHTLRSVMNDQEMLSVTVSSSIEIGPRWGTLSHVP